MSSSSTASEEPMGMGRSPIKLSKERFKEGMRVMFVNTTNFRFPAFATGTLGRRQVSDPEDVTFAIEWETPISTEVFDRWYDDIPLILDNINKDDEIRIRAYVYEARMVSYGCYVRDAVTLEEPTVQSPFDQYLTDYGLNKPTCRVSSTAARMVIIEANKQTTTQPIATTPTATPTDSVPLPMELYQPIRDEAMARVPGALLLEDKLGKDPALEQFVQPDMLLKNISPIVKWAYQYATTTEVPEAGGTTLPSMTTQTSTANTQSFVSAAASAIIGTTSPRTPFATAIGATPPPKTLKTPPSSRPVQSRTIPEDARKIDLTPEPDEDIDISDTIPRDIPTCQTMGKLIGVIRISKFGQLEKMKNLEDVEVMVAYVTFLLMILGKNTTSNPKMYVEHDWYATHEMYRKAFINGFYATWEHRKETWASTKKFKNPNNDLLAAIGTITATSLRMTDEHLLQALAEGSGMTKEKVYHMIVGRPNYITADVDACKILKNPMARFADAPDGKGKLYETMINMLPNANLLHGLRTVSRELNLHEYGIQVGEAPVPRDGPDAPGKRKALPPAKNQTASPPVKRKARSAELDSVWAQDRVPMLTMATVMERDARRPMNPIDYKEDTESQEEEQTKRSATNQE